MLKKRFITLFFIFILVGVLESNCALNVEAQEKKAPPALPPARVEVVEVSRVPLMYRGYRESSTLEAMEEVVIFPRVTGRLDKFSAREGEPVKKGQVLAELDHRDVNAQINSIKAQIAVAEARLASSRASFANAEREKDRYGKLVKEGYATSQQLESKETAYLQALADVRLQKASILQYRAELSRHEVNLSEYFLKSPITGRVMDDYSHTIGEMISPSIAVAKIGVTEKLKAVIKAPSGRAVHFREGMKAFLSVTSLPEGNFSGNITMISTSVDAATRTTKVEVSLSNDKDLLKPGMFAEVYIIEKEAENALVIPREALFVNEEENFVFLVRDGVVAKVPVKIGIENEVNYEVLEGLKMEDQIVVSGGGTLKDGDKVTVVR